MPQPQECSTSTTVSVVATLRSACSCCPPRRLRLKAQPAPHLQVALSLVLNWLIGPALMTGLAWATLPDLEGYRNGVILVRVSHVTAEAALDTPDH